MHISRFAWILQAIVLHVRILGKGKRSRARVSNLKVTQPRPQGPLSSYRLSPHSLQGGGGGKMRDLGNEDESDWVLFS